MTISESSLDSSLRAICSQVELLQQNKKIELTSRLGENIQRVAACLQNLIASPTGNTLEERTIFLGKAGALAVQIGNIALSMDNLNSKKAAALDQIKKSVKAIEAFETAFCRLDPKAMEAETFQAYDADRAKLKEAINILKSLDKKFQPKDMLKTILSDSDAPRLKEFQKLAKGCMHESDNDVFQILKDIDAKGDEGYLDWHNSYGGRWLFITAKTFKHIIDPQMILEVVPQPPKNHLSGAYVQAFLDVHSIIKELTPATTNDIGKLQRFIQEQTKNLIRYETQFSLTPYSKLEGASYEDGRKRLEMAAGLLLSLDSQLNVPETSAIWSQERFKVHKSQCQTIDCFVDYLEISEEIDEMGLAQVQKDMPVPYEQGLDRLQEAKKTFLTLDEKSQEDILQPLRKTFNHDDVNSLVFSFHYRLNKNHLVSGIKIELPQEKAEGVTLKQLPDLFDQAGFSDEELTALNLKSREESKKDLHNFVAMIEQQQVRDGTPKAGSPALKDFYEDLEKGITHIIKKFNEMSNTLNTSGLKKEVVAELVRASWLCGVRQRYTVLMQFMHVIHQHTPTFGDSIAALCAEHRNIALHSITARRAAEAKARNDERRESGEDVNSFDLRMENQSIHYYNGLVRRFGKEFGIPGHELLTQYEDEFVLEPHIGQFMEERNRFFALYTENSIVEILYSELEKTQHLRDQCLNWWKVNMPYKWNEEKYALIKAKVSELWQTGSYKEVKEYLNGPEVDKYLGEGNCLFVAPNATDCTPQGIADTIEKARVDQFLMNEVQEAGKPGIRKSAVIAMLVDQGVLSPTDDDEQVIPAIKQLAQLPRPIGFQEKQAFVLQLYKLLSRTNHRSKVVRWAETIFMETLKDLQTYDTFKDKSLWSIAKTISDQNIPKLIESDPTLLNPDADWDDVNEPIRDTVDELEGGLFCFPKKFRIHGLFLRSLDVSEIDTKDSYIKEISFYCPYLEVIDLAWTLITGKTLGDLPKSIKEIFAYRCCKLTDEAISELKKLPNLKKIDFSQNANITGKTLGDLPESIEEIVLDKCKQLTNENILLLLKLPNLKNISLKGTKVTQEMVQQFQNRNIPVNININ